MLPKSAVDVERVEEVVVEKVLPLAGVAGKYDVRLE